MIVVVSHPNDDHAAAVMAELDLRGDEFLLVDTAAFPQRISLVERFGNRPPVFELVFDGISYDLSRWRVGWWRRPQPYELNDDLASDVFGFVYSECNEALAGLWEALPIMWVNPPKANETAQHKPYQLSCANEAGLQVPKTLITNDPAKARTFVDDLGPSNTVYKTFLATEQHWRETRLLRQEELALLERVRLAPVIFQEYIPAELDVRVTIVGNRMFAAAIDSSSGDYEVDYRMALDSLSFEPTELPSEVHKRLAALMKRLGLIFGAVDLRKTPDGAYVFLEINPAGEWRFIEERTGQPITKAMASLLAGRGSE